VLGPSGSTFVLKAYAECGARRVQMRSAAAIRANAHYIEQNYKALRRFQLLARTIRGARHRAGASPARLGQRRRGRSPGQRDRPRDRRGSRARTAQLAGRQHGRPGRLQPGHGLGGHPAATPTGHPRRRRNQPRACGGGADEPDRKSNGADEGRRQAKLAIFGAASCGRLRHRVL